MARLAVSRKAAHCRRIFLHHFPAGFRDATYLAWERDYKVAAHDAWERELNEERMAALLDAGDHAAIAKHALRIEGRTNLLFSFEKMALRDAVRMQGGDKLFATGLHAFLYGDGSLDERFDRWIDTIARLPRKQTRVLTWPVATVFGMIAQPKQHIFLKPWVTQTAAEMYGVDVLYESRPNWYTYRSLLDFAARVRRDTRDLRPRDMIDLQSYIWVLGSCEYD